MKVNEIMASPAITVGESTSLEDVARLMLDKGIGCVPVVDADGIIAGIVTEASFAAKSKGIPFSTFRAPQLLGRWLSDTSVANIYAEARQTPVSEIMVKNVVTIEEDESVNRAVELMLEHDINRIPVVRDGKPVGIVARHDLLRLMAGRV
ncbi:MAG: CBS domain-containing protein [Acidobacteriota bacterium]|nr:MAG: CBS domain-containing protein [Acidobacteriota bacterium]